MTFSPSSPGITDRHMPSARESILQHGAKTYSYKQSEPDQLREKFYNLYLEWGKETLLSSNLHQNYLNMNYQQIIGMGKEALPFIFETLRKAPDHFFWALIAITCENPIKPENEGALSLMTEDWIKWATNNGYVFR